MSKMIVLLSVVGALACGSPGQRETPTQPAVQPEEAAPAVVEGNPITVEWFREPWYAMLTYSGNEPYIGRLCVCEKRHGGVQVLVGEIPVSIPNAGRFRVDTSGIVGMLRGPRCQCQIDLTTGKCACPEPLGPVAAAWHTGARVCDPQPSPEPTPEPSPEPTPTPRTTPGPTPTPYACIDEPAATLTLTGTTRDTLVARAQVEDSGDWNLCISASSSLAECEANDPDYWKKCVPAQTECDDEASLLAEYRWKGHRSEWWRAVLFRNGEIMEDVDCESNPHN